MKQISQSEQLEVNNVGPKRLEVTVWARPFGRCRLDADHLSANLIGTELHQKNLKKKPFACSFSESVFCQRVATFTILTQHH